MLNFLLADSAADKRYDLAEPTFAAPGQCAFVHRKSRFFAGGRSRHDTRAGGVSPPWVHYRYCTGVREHTAGGLSRLCGGAFAIALR
jgi:hypothetical protein